MAREFKQEDIDTTLSKHPNYGTTEGLTKWLKHLAENYYDSEWDAMHDKGFRGLLKKLVNQATPEEIEKLGNQDDYKTNGNTFKNLKGMFDEGEKGLNRRDYLTRFMNTPIDEVDMFEKGSWKGRKVYPEDLGISDVSKYEDLVKGNEDVYEVANKIGLDIAPNADNKKFGELKEDLVDWVLDQRKEPTSVEKKPDGELDAYTKDLNDYISKNKKGRDDIPVATRR